VSLNANPEEEKHHGQPPAEYEREPVPAKAQLGLKEFVGMYAL